MNGECIFGRFICQNCGYFTVYDKLQISNTWRAYSVSDRVTIDGVPADRRSESLVVKSGCEDTCTLEGALKDAPGEAAAERAVICADSVVLS